MTTNKNNILLFLLLLVVSSSIGLFSSVEALQCYEQGLGNKDEPERRDELKEVKCKARSIIGCTAALGCDGHPDMRECSDEDICQVHVSEGKAFKDICKHCEFCTGNMCNNMGLEKSGLKCIGKDEESGEVYVEECLKSHVACVAAWDCKGRPEKTIYGCTRDKNYCTQRVGNACNCKYCTSDLCNDEGIKEKPTIGGKPTPPKSQMPKPTKKEVDKPKPNDQQKPTLNSMQVEQSTPKTDVEKQQPEPEDNKEEEAKSGSPNGAAVGIVGRGQMVIIPIVMMTLMLGAGFLKMLII